MTGNTISQKKSEGKAPFVAIKWADTLRLENDFNIPANWIQLYPVIATFQNNGCYLSLDKLALYAGMRKADVKPTISRLIEKGWINEDRYKGRKSYKLTNQYMPGFAERFYMIGTELVKSGVWGAMQQTRQVIYSILQAFSKHSAYIDPYCAFSDSEPDYTCLENMYVCGYPVKDCSYLDAKWYYPDKIILSAQKCGITCSRKTFQRAMRYLQEEKLMIFFYESYSFFFPRKPGLKANGFEERLKKIEDAQKDNKISYAAKRAMIAAKKRNQENKGNSKFTKIQ